MGFFNILKKIPKDQKKLISLLKHYDVDCVFDIGANIGQYSQGIRKAGYKKNIVSFEPLGAMHNILENVSSSDKLWEIYKQTCIGAEVGETEINISNSSDMSSILNIEEDTLKALPKSIYIGKEKVDITTVDNIYPEYKKYKNIFLKADTQGFEWEVLQGAKNSLPNICGIQLELSLFSLYEGEKTFEEITSWLKDNNFEPILIIPGYFSKKLMKQLQIDIIFFRKDLN